MLTEVVIDSGCATFAEVRKRADVFWDEFEFYLSDLLVGIVLDVALVTLLAPVAAAGAPAAGKAAMAAQTALAKTKGVAGVSQRLAAWSATLPAAVFERSIPGVREYSLGLRAQAFLFKGIQVRMPFAAHARLTRPHAHTHMHTCTHPRVGAHAHTHILTLPLLPLPSRVFFFGAQYGAVGFVCGLAGQSLANAAILAKRSVLGASAASVAVPPLFRTGCVWALFMGVSSNTRYQLVFAIEALIEGTALAQKMPMMANVGTVVVRFANNIYGGEQFVDLARWAGIQ